MDSTNEVPVRDRAMVGDNSFLDVYLEQCFPKSAITPLVGIGKDPEEGGSER